MESTPGSNSEKKIVPTDATVEACLVAFEEIVNADPPPTIPDPPVAVLPWLYLAPLACVYHQSESLKALGITHVLSTNRMPPAKAEEIYWELRSYEIDHLYIPADDLLTYDMMQHWPECREFLQACCPSCDPKKKNEQESMKKALVHCAAGMNRSGTMTAAAMMEFANMSLLHVARRLKEQRGYVMSNASFRKQLVAFAVENGYADATIEADRPRND